jgi:uncharacterized protein
MLRLGVSKSLAAAALAFALACARHEVDDASLRNVRVAGVRIDPATSSPEVELIEDGGQQRTLTIWIGEFEADSIARAIEHQTAPRPNSHDLLKNLVDTLHGRVQRTVVTDLRAGTYFAVIDFELRGSTISVDARPSDAIAIALRAGAPVLVRDSLFRAGEIPEDEHALEVEWMRNSRECRLSAPL